MMEHRHKTADLTVLFPWDLLFSLDWKDYLKARRRR